MLGDLYWKLNSVWRHGAVWVGKPPAAGLPGKPLAWMLSTSFSQAYLPVTKGKCCTKHGSPPPGGRQPHAGITLIKQLYVAEDKTNRTQGNEARQSYSETQTSHSPWQDRAHFTITQQSRATMLILQPDSRTPVGKMYCLIVKEE